MLKHFVQIFDFIFDFVEPFSLFLDRFDPLFYKTLHPIGSTVSSLAGPPTNNFRKYTPPRVIDIQGCFVADIFIIFLCTFFVQLLHLERTYIT